MQRNETDLRELLPRGAIAEISKELHISPQAVGKALKRGNATSPAVAKAVERIEQSGVVAVRDKLQRLINPS